MFNLSIKLYYLYRPADAKERVELICKQMAVQKMLEQEILPIKKCVVEEIDSNTNIIHILVSHVSITTMIIIKIFYYNIFGNN